MACGTPEWSPDGPYTKEIPGANLGHLKERAAQPEMCLSRSLSKAGISVLLDFNAETSRGWGQGLEQHRRHLWRQGHPASTLSK